VAKMKAVAQKKNHAKNVCNRGGGIDSDVAAISRVGEK